MDAMGIVAWICSAALAVTYIPAGVLKLVTPKEKLQSQRNFGWAQDWSARDIKGIGLAEVLGGIGVILPWLLGIAMVLTPIAALGLAVLQVAAAVVHGRRGETKVIGGNVLLFLLAAVVAVLRFTQL